MWLVCAQKNGVSALGLQRVLGFGSYQTAWAWLHKLRRAMVVPDRQLLGGPAVTVEMDSTFIGGRSGRKFGDRYGNKAEVVIAVELKHPKGPGHVRLTRIDSQHRRDEIMDFARANIAPGTVLYTDGDQLYNRLPREVMGVRHERIVLLHSAEPAHQLLPAVHRVAALLKRWLAGTLHDGQAIAHLEFYLDEFTFRFNRRSSRSRGLLWYRLVQQAIATHPYAFRDLVAAP